MADRDGGFFEPDDEFLGGAVFTDVPPVAQDFVGFFIDIY